MNTNIFILGSEGGLEPPSLIFIIQRHATIAPLAASMSRKTCFQVVRHFKDVTGCLSACHSCPVRNGVVFLTAACTIIIMYVRTVLRASSPFSTVTATIVAAWLLSFALFRQYVKEHSVGCS